MTIEREFSHARGRTVHSTILSAARTGRRIGERWKPAAVINVRAEEIKATAQQVAQAGCVMRRIVATLAV